MRFPYSFVLEAVDKFLSYLMATLAKLAWKLFRKCGKWENVHFSLCEDERENNLSCKLLLMVCVNEF